MIDSNRVKTAIQRIQAFEPPEGYYVAFSGGKDSLVTLTLTQMAGVKYDLHTSITGTCHEESVDPPELIEFIHKYYPETEFEFSKTTMWELIPKKLMPPTRIVRYCCDPLKPHHDKSRTVITGVRWAESAKRKKLRAMLEINLKSKYMMKVNTISDGLAELETTKMRTRHVLNPIIDWTSDDVWAFIRHYALPYCRNYDEGFTRMGCIGCPMSGHKGILREFKRYPTYKQKYLDAFEKMIEARKEKGYGLNFFVNPDAVMDWYIYGKTKSLDGQLYLFSDNT